MGAVAVVVGGNGGRRPEEPQWPKQLQQSTETFEPPQSHSFEEASDDNYVYSSDEGSPFSMSGDCDDGGRVGSEDGEGGGGNGPHRKISAPPTLARSQRMTRDEVSLGKPAFRIPMKKNRHRSPSVQTSLIRNMSPSSSFDCEMKIPPHPPPPVSTIGQEQQYLANSKKVSFDTRDNDDGYDKCLGRSARALESAASLKFRQRTSWKGTTTEKKMASIEMRSSASCLHTGKWNGSAMGTATIRRESSSEGANVVGAGSGNHRQRKQPQGQRSTSSPNHKEIQWNKNFLVMEAYIRNHGTCDVPDGHTLLSWVRQQRNTCRKWIRDDNNDNNVVDSAEEQLISKMLDRHIRISRLQSIGFDWGGGEGMVAAVRVVLATEQMLLDPRSREKLEAALSSGRSRGGTAKTRKGSPASKSSPTRNSKSVLDSMSSKWPRQHRLCDEDEGECEFSDSSPFDPSLRSSRRTNNRNDKDFAKMMTDSSDDISAPATAQSSRKRSRSEALLPDKDGGASAHHVDDIDGVSNDGNEFIDDFPDIISWSHHPAKLSVKRHKSPVAEGRERNISSKLPGPPPSEASPTSSTTNIAPPEVGGRHKFCSDLERAGGPLESGWGVVEIVQSTYDDIAKIKQAKSKHADSTLRDSTLRDSTTAPAPSLRADRPPIKKKNMMKMLTRPPLLTAGSQLGLRIPVLRVGKRVFAPWCKGWTVGKDVSNVPGYYYPGVIVSRRIVEKDKAKGSHAGSSKATSSHVVLYNVRFDDGDIAENYLKRNLKPLLRVGDEVYAAWWENPRNRTTAASWHPGIIKYLKDLDYGGRYGLIRLYDVR